MAVAPAESETLLKGDRFAARVAEICRVLPEVSPLADLKYKRILIPGLLGGEVQFSLMAFVAHALRIRGAEITALLCDKILPACTLRKVDHYESACDRWCFRNAQPFIRAARLSHRWYGDFITARERESCIRDASLVPVDELMTFEFRGLHLGYQIDRSIESYFKVGKVDLDNPAMVAKGREFLASAMILTFIGERALDTLEIEKVFVEDGEKIDWGIIRAVARHRGIPVDLILGAPRGDALLIEHDPAPEPSDPLSMWSTWKDIPLTQSQDAELDAYFDQRAVQPYENHDWTAIRPAEDAAEIRREIGLPDTRTGLTFALFPNLSYDAFTTARNPAYDSAAEWVADTIRFFQTRPEHHIVVKIHPAEAMYPPLDPTADFLTAQFGALPQSVHVVAPETPLTAHDLLAVTDVAMIYTSTVGAEAASFGIPVINVGGGYHAQRGCSTDVTTPEQYYDVLTEFCSGRATMTPSRELGRRYAYAVFFRSLLPIRHYRSTFPNVTGLNLDTLDDLAPGRDPTIDVICRGVLADAPFHNAGQSPW